MLISERSTGASLTASPKTEAWPFVSLLPLFELIEIWVSRNLFPKYVVDR